MVRFIKQKDSFSIKSCHHLFGLPAISFPAFNFEVQHEALKVGNLLFMLKDFLDFPAHRYFCYNAFRFGRIKTN